MRKVKLYIATSLDNFIARPNGDIDWLESIHAAEDEDYGYGAFYKGIDTTVMGMATYRQILGFDVPFPYPDKRNYVLTRQKGLAGDAHVQFVCDDIIGFIKTLKSKPGKDIWLVGGAQINTLFLEHGLIDEMILSRMPILIGRGIPLFTDHAAEQLFHLDQCKSFKNGVVQLTYKKP